MANQGFDYGLFGDGQSSPQSDYSENFRPVGGAESAAAAALQYNSTGAVRGNAFGQLTEMVTKSRRMNAIKEARANGITPESGEIYYSFIRDRLTDYGDMQGAELVETKRLQAIQLKTESDYKKAQTQRTLIDNDLKTQEFNTNAPERKLRVAERSAGQVDRQLDQGDERIATDKLDQQLRGREQDWKERTWDSPIDKFNRDKELLRINHGYDLDLEDVQMQRAIKTEQIKRGIASDKPLTATEAKLGTANWLTHLQKLKASDKAADQAKLKRLEESAGIDVDTLLTDASGNESESLIAKGILATQGARAAVNYKDLKSNFPQADEASLWEEAVSVPTDARLLRVGGKFYWYVSPTEAYEAGIQ